MNKNNIVAGKCTRYLLLPCLFLLVGACCREQLVALQEENLPLQITTVQTNLLDPVTRNNQILERPGAKMGLFRKSDTLCYNEVGNVPYIYQSGKWQPEEPGKAILLNQRDATIAACYPYSNTLSRATGEEGSVRLLAQPRNPVSPQDLWYTHFSANAKEQHPSLTLGQAYCRINIVFVTDQHDTYPSPLYLHQFSFSGGRNEANATEGILTSSTLDLFTGTYRQGEQEKVTPLSVSTNRYPIEKTQLETQAAFDVLMIPAALTGNVTLTVVVNIGTEEFMAKAEIPANAFGHNTTDAGRLMPESAYNIKVVMGRTGIKDITILTSGWAKTVVKDPGTALEGELFFDFDAPTEEEKNTEISLGKLTAGLEEGDDFAGSIYLPPTPPGTPITPGGGNLTTGLETGDNLNGSIYMPIPPNIMAAGIRWSPGNLDYDPVNKKYFWADTPNKPGSTPRSVFGAHFRWCSPLPQNAQDTPNNDERKATVKGVGSHYWVPEWSADPKNVSNYKFYKDGTDPNETTYYSVPDPKTMTVETVGDPCKAMGDKWRMPTYNELFLLARIPLSDIPSGGFDNYDKPECKRKFYEQHCQWNSFAFDNYVTEEEAKWGGVYIGISTNFKDNPDVNIRDPKTDYDPKKHLFLPTAGCSIGNEINWDQGYYLCSSLNAGEDLYCRVLISSEKGFQITFFHLSKGASIRCVWGD